jgi:hypothetical protein
MRLIVFLLALLGAAGWMAALRERDRVEELTEAAREAARSIRRDAVGAAFRQGGDD